MANTKVKNYKIIETTTNPTYVNKTISLQEIKKPDGDGKRGGRHGNHKAPAWFKTFETRFDSLVEKVDNIDVKVNDLAGKVDNLEKNDIKIFDILNRNNLK